MLNRRWFRVFSRLLILALILGISSSLIVHAQTASQVVINFLEAVDTPDQNGVTLRTYFTLTDSSRKPVSNFQIKSATFALDASDGGDYPAKVSKASGPISLVIALDTSGSMRYNQKKIQTAATQFINDMPKDSRIAIIHFSDKVELLQDFTTDKTQLVNALGTLKGTGVTCLFDATYQAVQMLATGTAGRRAVVVLSGGVDQNFGGQPCSKHTVSDIDTLATDRKFRVPIYNIGLKGFQPIDEADLRNISGATGGAVSIGGDLTAIFKDVTDDLNSQFVAEALVKPQAGERNLVLRIVLDDNSVPNADTAVFSSPRDYSIKPTALPTVTPTFTITPSPTVTQTLTPTFTPIPSQANITTVKEDLTAKEFTLSVQVQNESPIKRYHVEIINDTTNLLAKDFTFDVPPYDTVHVPESDLPGGKYSVRLTGLDADNHPVSPPSSIKLDYVVPTATPQPTETPTVTPTPLPEDFFSRLGRASNDPGRGPLVLGVFGVFVLGLIGFAAFIITRRRAKPETGTGFLREMTGAINVAELAPYTPSWTKGKAPASPQAAPAPEKTMYDLPDNGLPHSSLTVEDSRDKGSIGKVTSINRIPFKMGRADCDLNFPGDGSVSREHARITFENNVFAISDSGSTNGTFIDDVEVSQGTTKPLYDGATIRLGSVTTLTFRLDTGGQYDPDKTSPEPFKVVR